MCLKKLIIPLLVLLISASGALAQSLKLKKAEEAFKVGEYYYALDKYKAAYAKAKDANEKTAIFFKMGYCCRSLNQPRNAEKWFLKAIKGKYKDPIAVLYYADALKMQEKYDDAKAQYKEYARLAPDDARGEAGLKMCTEATEWIKKPSRFVVEPVRDLNSKQMDFAPCYNGAEDALFLTSARPAGKGSKFNNVSGDNFADIYMSRIDRKGKWSVPVPIPGNVNTALDEGSPWLSDDGKTMYFTRCNMEKKQAIGGRIFYSVKVGEKWSEALAVDFIGIKDSSVSIGHPSLTQDMLTMYFASDWTKGSKGGKDIWVSTRKAIADPWGEPINLGSKINTSGDELFPYIHSNGTLYFASNGHPGMGGLDIFKATKNDKGDWVVENMKYPINSSADDFGLIINKDENAGFFSSSRAGGRGADDIYSFILPPLEFNLHGVVQEEGNNMPLYDVAVKMTGSDGSTDEAKTEKDGAFDFKLKPNVDYVVVTSKKNYLNGKGQETTRGLKESTTLKMLITMASTATSIELPNILYDLNKADLRPESMVSLDKLVETLNENPSVVIELAAHTDSRGSDELNNDLSQRRAQSVVNYLITKGIDSTRLAAKGYGKTVPRTVTKKMAEANPFMREGDVLNDEYINALNEPEQKEAAYQANRRTEFKVLSMDFKKKYYFDDKK